MNSVSGENSKVRSKFTLPSHANLKKCLQLIAASILTCSLLLETQNAEAQTLPSTQEEIINEAIEEPLKGFEENARRRGSCEIVVTREGKLRSIPGRNVLTSIRSGGHAGRARVTASKNNAYRISIDSPLGFNLAPINGNNGVTFTASYSGRGATSFTRTPGQVSKLLKRGSTVVRAHLHADRGSNPFPAGQYQAQLILRCE